MGCWWGSPRRSRALDSGPTITGGRSRSPSDSRRGLVPVAPPAPRPRREGRACAPQSSDIICSPPAALAADGTPRRGSRARSLHGPRHTSPIAAPPPIVRPGFGSHTRTVCMPRVGCSHTSPERPAKKQAPRLVEQPGDLVHLCTEKRRLRLTAGASVVSVFVLRRHSRAALPAFSVYTISSGPSSP